MLGERDLLFLGCAMAKIMGHYRETMDGSGALSQMVGLSTLLGNEYNPSGGNYPIVKENAFLDELRELHKLIYYDTKKTF